MNGDFCKPSDFYKDLEQNPGSPAGDANTSHPANGDALSGLAMANK